MDSVFEALGRECKNVRLLSFGVLERSITKQNANIEGEGR